MDGPCTGFSCAAAGPHTETFSPGGCGRRGPPAPSPYAGRVSPAQRSFLVVVVLYGLVRQGQERSGAAGWDIAAALLALLVGLAGAFLARTEWRAGRTLQAVLYAAVGLFALWTAGSGLGGMPGR